MVDYSPQIALAKRLVRAKGRQVTLQRLSRVATDPAKPWRASDQSVLDAEAPLTVVAVPPSSASSLGLRWDDADPSKSLEQILIAEVGETHPEELGSFDRVLDSDGSVWRINFVEQLRPAEQSILYFLGVAR